MRARTFAVPLVSGAAFLLLQAQAELPAVPAVPAPPAATAAPAASEQRVHGTITEFDGAFITVKLTGKKTATLGMTTATRIVRVRNLKLTDLQPGAWVGVASLKGADNKLRAQGIRLYPPNMRGQNEGAYLMDAANPARILVNGTVTVVTPGGVGGVLSVAYHGANDAGAPQCFGHAAPGGVGCNGLALIQFARGVPIISFEGGDASALLPGATVAVTASADAGGTLIATLVTIERDAPVPKAAPAAVPAQ
jgi:hypothetical protein